MLRLHQKPPLSFFLKLFSVSSIYIGALVAQSEKPASLDILVLWCISWRIYGRRTMKTTKIFRSGNSQAVRIPKEFQMEGEEVEIIKKGATLVLLPKRKSWAALIDSLEKFTDDFMGSGRKQPRVQKRRRAFS